MIEIVALGTSGSTPTKDRHMPSFALIYDGDTLLFDCGEGTQMQMLKFGINPVKVKAIFLSHTHGDHVIGVAGLVRTMSMAGRQDPLLIFVPSGYESTVNNLLVFDKALLRFSIVIKGVKKGKVYEAKPYAVYAFRLNHTIPTYGYVFKENDKLHFVAEKAKKLGIKGSMFSELQIRKRLKVGRRTVRLDEVSWIEPGKKIVYATDTRPSKETVKAAMGADLLIHEAAYASGEKKLAKERKHSTAEEAASIAKQSKAKMLIMTHISARHRDAVVLEKEARKIFKNAHMAYDGMKISIR
ncbi:MAG: ribonuclease Z [Candidatus Micrarchaeia archaeon]